VIRSPVNLVFDASVGHHYVYIAQILQGDQIVQVWPMAYCTLGEAHLAWVNQIDGEYKKTQEGWCGELKRNLIALLKGHTVRITNLVVQTK
jgi:hypothetical protein